MDFSSDQPLFSPAQTVIPVAELSAAQHQDATTALVTPIKDCSCPHAGASLLWTGASELFFVPNGANAVSAPLYFLGTAGSLQAATALAQNTFGVRVTGYEPSHWNRPGDTLRPVTRLVVQAA